MTKTLALILILYSSLFVHFEAIIIVIIIIIIIVIIVIVCDSFFFKLTGVNFVIYFNQLL